VTESKALEVHGLRVGYGDLTAVWEADITATAGRTCALVGRNGAGKTTLLKGIAGLLRTGAGEVRLEGVDISGMPPHRRARSGLGLVQEGKRVIRSLTVRENLRMGLFARGGRSVDDKFTDVFERFPVLEERQSQLAGDLSGGQQQMLAIAQALVSNPTVLMIDEPSSGLAPIVVQEVFGAISRLKEEGMAIILVEQLIEDVLAGVADDVVVLEGGRVAMSCEASKVDADELLRSTYAA
jgi:branched-chain amino acid transport system ATP-binding protein